ncbi:hypothetical protein DPMN_140440 [Dreissena polymorpha]|uniref:Uncharacterized protein n=2 Tax=Dreissena polymorpha TaxID=45954 RepID=A0A9D4G7L6_DREPO|nr:hypothetical protein DPMN_140440 [Dreissena polymorpha]
MGFDTDRFLTAVNDDLTCCICRDVLEDPVQSPCEHAFCRSCIMAWLVHETICPEDRLPLSRASLRSLSRYMQNDLNRLQIRCCNQPYGCDHVTDLEFISSHERSCEFQCLKCPNEQCAYFASRADVERHKRSCEKGKKQCEQGCGFLINTSYDPEHNCVQELRIALEILRSEITFKYEEQKKDFDLRLDLQRNHMIQKLDALQIQVDDLTAENSRMSSRIMDMELQHRQNIERLEHEHRKVTAHTTGSARYRSMFSFKDKWKESTV